MAKGGFSTGFAGFLIGVVTGLGIAAGAALLITNSPIPFVEKVEKVTADVDPSVALSGGVDPNARLNRNAAEVQGATRGGVATVTIPGTGSADTAERDASGKAVAPGRVTPVTYWVQVGSYTSEDEAETGAAQLAMMGIGTKITSESGRWRVRVGPFDDKTSAEEALNSLSDQGYQPLIAEQRQ